MNNIDVSKVKLTDADRSEVLRYLGYRGQEMTDDLTSSFNECMDLVNSAADPRILIKIFPLGQDESHLNKDQDGTYPPAVLPDELSFLEGSDIRRHLSGCSEAVLLAATIGMKQDIITRQLSLSDPLKSVIVDSAGSVLIEAVCDTAEAYMRQELLSEGKFLTSRFSPGYGDLPLMAQEKFSQILEMRRVGITVSSDYLMSPRKSVTAVLGIASHEVKKHERSCASCNLKGACRFRQMGFFCSE